MLDSTKEFAAVTVVIDFLLAPSDSKEVVTELAIKLDFASRRLHLESKGYFADLVKRLVYEFLLPEEPFQASSLQGPSKPSTDSNFAWQSLVRLEDWLQLSSKMQP